MVKVCHSNHMKYRLIVLFLLLMPLKLYPSNIYCLDGYNSDVEVSVYQDLLYFLLDSKADTSKGDGKAISRICTTRLFCTDLQGEIIWERVVLPSGNNKSMGLSIDSFNKQLYVLARLQTITDLYYIQNSKLFCYHLNGERIWEKGVEYVCDKMAAYNEGVLIAGSLFGKGGKSYVYRFSPKGEQLYFDIKPYLNFEYPMFYADVAAWDKRYLFANVNSNKFGLAFLEVEFSDKRKVSFLKNDSTKSSLILFYSLFSNADEAAFLSSSKFADPSSIGVPVDGFDDDISISGSPILWSDHNLVLLNFISEKREMSVAIDTIWSMQYGYIINQPGSYIVCYASTTESYLVEVSKKGQIIKKRTFTYADVLSYETIKKVVKVNNELLLIGSTFNKYKNEKLFCRKVAW